MYVIKSYWRAWQPVRLRRLLAIKEQQLARSNDGWSKMNNELLTVKEKCKHLEAEVARLERLAQ